MASERQVGAASAGAVAAPGAPSFAAFYDRTVGTAFSLALRIARERDAAERICESAYAALWAERPGPSPEAEPRLLELVRQGAIDHRRQSERSADPSDTYSVARAVDDALTGTDPLARRALELVYFGGMPVDAAAELLGRAPGDVRQALRGALLTVARAVPMEQKR